MSYKRSTSQRRVDNWENSRRDPTLYVLSPLVKFKKELIDKDPRAIAIQKLCLAAGLEIAFKNDTHRVRLHHTIAILTIKRIIGEDPTRAFKALCCVRNACVKATQQNIEHAFKSLVTEGPQQVVERLRLRVSAVPQGHLADIATSDSYLPPVQSETLIHGVRVRRFEAGGYEQIMERVLAKAGHTVEFVHSASNKGKVKLVRISNKPHTWEEAVKIVNDLRAADGFEPL